MGLKSLPLLQVDISYKRYCAHVLSCFYPLTRSFFLKVDSYHVSSSFYSPARSSGEKEKEGGDNCGDCGCQGSKNCPEVGGMYSYIMGY